MENQNHIIDEIFRQRLHDSEVPPPPFVWPAVEQELRKRRRKMAFLWFGSFGVVAATAILLWHSDLWNASQGSQLSATSQEISVTGHSSPNPQEILPGSDQNSMENRTADMPAANIADRETEQISAEADRNAAAQRSNKGNHIQPQAKQNESTTKNIPAAQNSAENKPIAYQIAEESGAFTPVLNSFELLGVQALAIVSSDAATQAGLAPKTYKSHSRKKKQQPKVCYDFARHPNAWLVDVYAGPSLAQRSLTSRVDDTPYLNQRLATERRSLAYNAGVRASLMFNSNFLVRTGLNYEQITEVFEFIDPTSVTYILKFTPGDPIPDTLGVQYGENYLKTYNRYGMLDVPMMVGIEMRRGRTGFSINAGLMANILFRKSGVIMDPNTQEPARFGPIPDNPKAAGPKNSVSEPVFRSNLGLSANASIQWYWHLSPNFRVFAEPSFRQVLRPVTLGSHPVEQRYSIMGLRLGATRIF